VRERDEQLRLSASPKARLATRIRMAVARPDWPKRHILGIIGAITAPSRRNGKRVVQAYSMQGFEIRIDGQVLEMRTDGTRTAAMGRDPGRSFESFLANTHVTGILFDVRGADYQLDEIEWEERARLIARVCQGHPTAFVNRQDQDIQVARVLHHLEARGGRGLSCRSRQAARIWLGGVTDHPGSR